MAHNIIDSDTRFVINPITRQIRNESSRKTVLIQNDHNSERFTFSIDRIVEGHDMMLCSKVEVHYLNIAADRKTMNSGMYTVNDLHEDGGNMVCSWLISNNATKLVGSLNFLVKFICLEGGDVTYVWHTAIHTGITISDGINAGEMLEEDYVDIIEQWKAEVTRRITDDVNANVTAWKEVESANVRGVMNVYSAEWNEALNVERKRIDNMVAGGTVDDAELMDVRVGADGVIYDSAGAAVRAQGERISGEVDTLADAIFSKIVVANLFDNRKSVVGYIANDGSVQSAYYRYAMMVRPGDVIRFTYDELFDSQNGVFYDGGDKLLATVSSVAVNQGAYKEAVVPALATKIVLNLRHPSVFIITRNADYPGKYVPYQVEIPKQIVKYDNVEYIEDYNLYDENRLIDGYINASGVIITDVSDFKHIRVDVAPGDVIRYTYEDVFYSQNGGVYNANGVFLCNLTDKSENCGAYKEYVAGDDAGYILINFRITTKNVVSKNNRYDTSFDGFKMNASMPSGKYLDKLESMLDNKLANAVNAQAIKTNYHALFENVCCIGDSLTEGDYGNGLGVHNYNYPRAFANLTGCNVVNLGASGQSAKSWWEIKERKFTAESLDFSRYDCFFILLGQNGGLNGAMNSSDVSDLGYYCKIIEAIKTKSPNASIFLLTIPHNIADGANDNTNAIIKSVGVNYDIPVLDLRDSEILTVENIPINQPYDNAMHYGKVGSLHLAMEVKRLMEESIYADKTRYNVINS